MEKKEVSLFRMLNSRYRLKKSSHFKKVYQGGNSVAGRRIVCYWLPNDRDRLQIGFSVSKKVGNAVTRNRVKRMLRNSINQYLPLLKPVNLVIIARVKIVEASYKEIEKEMKYLFKKAKLN
ncbi:MAG: ribonuclease P protein component [Clostridia bacterium]|nr:ribonuclease P protein component [Clostridia bacterium]